jgi:hypothetical protein
MDRYIISELLFVSDFIPALLFSKNTYRYVTFLNDALEKLGIEKITFCTAIPIKVYRSWLEIGSRHPDVTASRSRPLRNEETTKHLEWRLCGSAVSNLGKTSDMYVN